MKEFVVYTALRVLLFLASFALIAGVWLLASDNVPVLWVVVLAFVVSGVVSYFLLNRFRVALAERVDQRAARATAAFEAMRSREDAD